jgi:NADH-quinone oxidoreductase subunit L
LWALQGVVREGNVSEGWEPLSWLQVGDISFTVGILLDPLTAIMLVVVTGVSLMVQIYSTGYMRGDPGYARYFAYMSLFTASMVGLVMASNIVQLYVFWELVGLCSYLLIGFWYHRPAAAAAAKKAFIVTRLGDFGFLLAILYLVFKADVFAGGGQNALDISVINTALPDAAMAGLIGTSVITWIAIGIFLGAVGKSAQFPLHTWLPDAMEGPTPVSALIHAATMVVAGVFLVARFFPLFEISAVAMNTVALIGGGTAVFAASMALVANDIKRVLAYSTISQLGFMMLALGVGAYEAAIFHLFTHAFFKALLFMGAGSVNHATGTFDMRYMGGLRRVMPWTYATFLIAGLSLAGIFPLAGFWSKDEIMAYAAGGGAVSQLVFWLAIAAIFMTAFYIFRALFMTFEGDFRGGAEADPEPPPGGEVHLAESPAVMVWPLVVLGVASVLTGFVVNPTIDLGIVSSHWLTHFLGVDAESFNWPVAILSTALSLAGIALAYLMYVSRHVSTERLGQTLRPAYVLLSRKYYFDEFYEGILTIRVVYGWLARSLDWADKVIVDGVVRDIDRLGRNVGRAMAQAQTGQVQGYGVAISVGVLAMLGVFLLLR